MNEEANEDKPRVQLTEHNGNAFMIMALCQQAARRAGWPKQRVDAVLNDMKSGDYDHLLQVALREFDVE
jgi:hypothetical protein